MLDFISNNPFVVALAFLYLYGMSGYGWLVAYESDTGHEMTRLGKIVVMLIHPLLFVLAIVETIRQAARPATDETP